MYLLPRGIAAVRHQLRPLSAGKAFAKFNAAMRAERIISTRRKLLAESSIN